MSIAGMEQNGTGLGNRMLDDHGHEKFAKSAFSESGFNDDIAEPSVRRVIGHDSSKTNLAHN